MYFVCNPNENKMIIRGKTRCHFPKIKIKERIWWWVNVSTNPLGRELVSADCWLFLLSPLVSDWWSVRALGWGWWAAGGRCFPLRVNYGRVSLQLLEMKFSICWNFHAILGKNSSRDDGSLMKTEQFVIAFQEFHGILNFLFKIIFIFLYYLVIKKMRTYCKYFIKFEKINKSLKWNYLFFWILFLCVDIEKTIIFNNNWL
jgi:hypothetical protein